jgi:hypothetical protein
MYLVMLTSVLYRCLPHLLAVCENAMNKNVKKWLNYILYYSSSKFRIQVVLVLLNMAAVVLGHKGHLARIAFHGSSICDIEYEFCFLLRFHSNRDIEQFLGCVSGSMFLS